MSRAVRPLLSFMFTSIPVVTGVQRAKARIMSNYVQGGVLHQVTFVIITGGAAKRHSRDKSKGKLQEPTSPISCSREL